MKQCHLSFGLVCKTGKEKESERRGFFFYLSKMFDGNCFSQSAVRTPFLIKYTLLSLHSWRNKSV